VDHRKKKQVYFVATGIAVSPDLSFIPQDAFGSEMRVLITWPCGTASLLTPVFCMAAFHFVL